MNGWKHKSGMTLIEILAVVAIIMILASIIIKVARRIDERNKEKLAAVNIAILAAAVDDFHNYGFNYKGDNYKAFDFPLDCNDFSTSKIEELLEEVLDREVSISNQSSHDKDFSGSEVLYFFLNKIPQTRQTLNKLDRSFVTCKGSDGEEMTITIAGGDPWPLFRVVDSWGKTLRYDYYDETKTKQGKLDSRRNFPVITSAGADGEFNTDDDITSR